MQPKNKKLNMINLFNIKKGIGVGLLFLLSASIMNAQNKLSVEDVVASNKFNTARVEGASEFLAGKNDTPVRFQQSLKNIKFIYRHSFTANCTVKDSETGKEFEVKGEIKIPTLSPDGRHLAFVRDNNIYLLNLQSLSEGEDYDKAEIAVTKDGEWNKVINGHADWVYEEEFAQTSMMAFTADGSAIAWVRFDESDVKEMQLQFHDGADNPYPRIYKFKYPKAGEDNSKVSLCTYELSSGKTAAKKLDIDKEDYIPVVRTIPADNSNVMVCTVNRHQDEMKLWKADCKSESANVIAKFTSKCYLPEEAVTDLTLYPDGFVVLNDNEGAMQPFLYDYNGKLIRRLIADKSVIVTAFYGYNFRTQSSYFQAVGKNPTQRVVYKADKKGKLTQLSTEEGWNDAFFSDDFSRYVLSYSNLTTPTKTTFVNGKKQKVVEDNAALKDTLAAEELPQREFFYFTTSEGVTLNGIIYKPKDFDPNKKYPVIFHQYSGPGSQQVKDSWATGSVARGGMYEAILCQHGYICVVVDPRGTGGRGADFQKLTYMTMGQMESRDQVEAALYMAKQPYVDASKMAIWGWSYGGFNTLMSMSEGRDVFSCGVSIAPPTSWRFYDSVYTERYMRTPQENPEGYGDNPIARAGKLHGNLLLCHGICDDNVHPQNTFEYTTQLVEAGKQFDMHVFTNSNHGIYNGKSRLFLLQKVLNFFDDQLK